MHFFAFCTAFLSLKTGVCTGLSLKKEQITEYCLEPVKHYFSKVRDRADRKAGLVRFSPADHDQEMKQ